MPSPDNPLKSVSAPKKQKGHHLLGVMAFVELGCCSAVGYITPRPSARECRR
jgi:hypothetical protein